MVVCAGLLTVVEVILMTLSYEPGKIVEMGWGLVASEKSPSAKKGFGRCFGGRKARDRANGDRIDRKRKKGNK